MLKVGLVVTIVYIPQMKNRRKINNSEVDEKPLPARLKEFRSALLEEIEAAKRAEVSSAVALTNGRRIAQVGSAYQYTFNVENALNLPGDAPGDLMVSGHKPLQVSVVSIEGLAITISVPEDIGQFVPTASLQSNMAHLMRKLIERIEEQGETANPVGDRILNPSLAVAGTAVPVQVDKLDEHQKAAVSSALGRNVTFIWGPPGTGKTMTIGNIGNELFKSERSVLLVSHTNSAVDGALVHIGKSVCSKELAEGRVVRVGQHDKRLDNNPYLLASTHVKRKSQELADKKQKLEDDRSQLEPTAQQLARKIELCEWVETAGSDIKIMRSSLDAFQRSEKELAELQDEHDRLAGEAQTRADRILFAKAVIELRRDLSSSQDRSSIIEAQVSDSKTKQNHEEQVLSAAQQRLSETLAVGRLLRAWKRLPNPEVQKAIVTKQEQQVADAVEAREQLERNLAELKSEIKTLAAESESVREEYFREPETVIQECNNEDERYRELQNKTRKLRQVCQKERRRLRNTLQAPLAILVEWQLVQQPATDDELEGALSAIEKAYGGAKEMTRGVAVEQLREELYETNGRIKQIDEESTEIEKALGQVETLVINEAMIVATTLTRAYLRDSIQGRRFDTVILDEASMAPIPALWIAAATAEKNAVVVGDFRQLPPIVLSDNEIARKWLGRDIFKVAEVNDPECNEKFFVALRKQYRMHPDISVIPNKLFYAGKLSDHPDTQKDQELDEWYNREWGFDTPLLLVDTGPIHAWVTLVPRTVRASRLNFLSATVSVDIAKSVLLGNRKRSPDEDPRVLLVAPYSPHAKLMGLLCREAKLDTEVKHGTVHTFQGREADIVILDLVNDEPHWRVGMFDPKRDDDMKRLFNVALTRAKRRLIVVGDFEYIQKRSRRAFIGKDLLPFLLSRYPVADARQVVPTGLTARAAEAQKSTVGGYVEPDHTRTLFTQNEFYRVLLGDIEHARQRIVFFSPYMTETRVSELAPQMRAAVSRGVAVAVVTKPLFERSKRERPGYDRLEASFADWGITIVHKRGMHEKNVFIDDNVLWNGSLNSLSQSTTQEIMERRESKEVFADFVRTLRLNDLLKEYETGTPKCPICCQEIVAGEGRRDPFYWSCTDKACYGRSIDEEPITGGRIDCKTCGAALEFAERAGKAVWRCKRDKRHWRKLAKTHIHLPKMRELIPRKKLKELEKLFNISGVTADVQCQSLFPMDDN